MNLSFFAVSRLVHDVSVTAKVEDILPVYEEANLPEPRPASPPASPPALPPAETPWQRLGERLGPALSLLLGHVPRSPATAIRVSY